MTARRNGSRFTSSRTVPGSLRDATSRRSACVVHGGAGALSMGCPFHSMARHGRGLGQPPSGLRFTYVKGAPHRRADGASRLIEKRGELLRADRGLRWISERPTRIEGRSPSPPTPCLIITRRPRRRRHWQCRVDASEAQADVRRSSAARDAPWSQRCTTSGVGSDCAGRCCAPEAATDSTGRRQHSTLSPEACPESRCPRPSDQRPQSVSASVGCPFHAGKAQAGWGLS